MASEYLQSSSLGRGKILEFHLHGLLLFESYMVGRGFRYNDITSSDSVKMLGSNSVCSDL